jgi:hypothetical protein
MATMTPAIKISGLGRGQLAALRKKASTLGTTPEAYVKKLIADDLELDRLVKSKSLSELSAPFREAFEKTSEEEIGELVEDARARHHRRLSKR